MSAEISASLDQAQAQAMAMAMAASVNLEFIMAAASLSLVAAAPHVLHTQPACSLVPRLSSGHAS